MAIKDIESAVEGILFAAGEPIAADRLCAVLDLDRETVEAVIRNLADYYAYEKRGIRIVRLEDSYQMCSAPEQAERIRLAFVEQMRGVDSAYTVNLLAERGLIEEAGRLAAPGRPVLFRTTKLFLRCFGLSSLEELPPLPDNGESGQLTMELEQAVEQLKQEQEMAEA